MLFPRRSHQVMHVHVCKGVTNANEFYRQYRDFILKSRYRKGVQTVCAIL